MRKAGHLQALYTGPDREGIISLLAIGSLDKNGTRKTRYRSGDLIEQLESRTNRCSMGLYNDITFTNLTTIVACCEFKILISLPYCYLVFLFYFYMDFLTTLGSVFSCDSTCAFLVFSCVVVLR